MGVAGLSALELPFRHQVFVDLGEKEGPGRNPGEGTDNLTNRKTRVLVAVKAGLLVVVIVLHHARVGTAVLEPRLSVVPTEVIGSQDGAVRATDLVRVAARVVVATVAAEVLLVARLPPCGLT